MTKHWQILPFVRVFVGDLDGSVHTDDVLVTVLQVTTAVLQILGYDKGHTSDPDGINPDLSEKEKALWGKCAAVLVQDPKAMQAAVDAVTVRTLGTTYSTEARARFVEATASEGFVQLRIMIRALGEPLVGTLDNLDRDTLP